MSSSTPIPIPGVPAFTSPYARLRALPILSRDGSRVLDPITRTWGPRRGGVKELNPETGKWEYLHFPEPEPVISKGKVMEDFMGRGGFT